MFKGHLEPIFTVEGAHAKLTWELVRDPGSRLWAARAA